VTLTLRDRIRQYWRLGGEYPETPEWFDPPTWVKWLGTVIVAVTGAVAALPFAVVVQLTAPYVPSAVTVVQALALVAIAYALAHYLGAPLADHLLGIPREVPWK